MRAVGYRPYKPSFDHPTNLAELLGNAVHHFQQDDFLLLEREALGAFTNSPGLRCSGMLRYPKWIRWFYRIVGVIGFDPSCQTGPPRSLPADKRVCPSVLFVTCSVVCICFHFLV